MIPTMGTKWSDAECQRLLATHWDEGTCTLDATGIINSLGGENAAADFFAAVLRSNLLGWRVYAAAALRRIITKHLDPETKWLAALWGHAIAYVGMDPDEMMELVKLLGVATSDRVRQWMATRLFSLCNAGTEEGLRVFAFQGLETLTKVGGLVHVKKFAKRLERMANTEEDPRFQLAAEGLRARLYPPPPVRIVKKPIAPVSKLPDLIESRLLTAAKTLLNHPDFLEVDMIAYELEPSAVLPPVSEDRRPPIRVLAGPLADLFPEDPYPSQIYPFLKEHKENKPLWVQIYGPAGNIAQYESGTFVTTLDNILAAAQEARALTHNANTLDTAAHILLNKDNTFDTRGDNEKRLQIARTVLLSTKYTYQLMSTSTFESQSSRLRRQPRLPHTDQRNLVFVPFWEGNICCAGMAILSHYPLSHRVTAAALIMLKKVVYDLRSAHMLTHEGGNG